MGRVFSAFSRELKNYNIESRAHKVISNDSRPAAPKYQSTIDQIKAVKDHGITMDEITKKDDGLSEKLKNIYVVSGGGIESSQQKSDKPLPVDRLKDWSDLEYGYVEPGKITPGKVSLKTTLDLLSKYNQNPVKWSTDNLASHFNISKKLADQLVDRYQVFELHINKVDEETDKKMSMEAKVQLQNTLRNINKITLLSDKSKEQVPTVAEIKPT